MQRFDFKSASQAVKSQPGLVSANLDFSKLLNDEYFKKPKEEPNAQALNERFEELSKDEVSKRPVKEHQSHHEGSEDNILDQTVKVRAPILNDNLTES